MKRILLLVFSFFYLHSSSLFAQEDGAGSFIELMPMPEFVERVALPLMESTDAPEEEGAEAEGAEQRPPIIFYDLRSEESILGSSTFRDAQFFNKKELVQMMENLKSSDEEVLGEFPEMIAYVRKIKELPIGPTYYFYSDRPEFLHHLMASLSAENDKIIYLIEGNIDEIPDDLREKVKPEQLRKAKK